MAPRLSAGSWRQLARPHTTCLPNASIRPSPSSPSTNLPLPLTARRGVRTGWSTMWKRARPTRFNQVTAGIPARTTGPAAALKRKERTTPVRTGVLAIKKGMTAFLGKRGARIPCTVLQLDGVQTIANKTRRKNGYWAVQVGIGKRTPQNVGAPMLGYYEAKGVSPKRVLAEFRVRGHAGLLPPGVPLMPDWFHIGQWVDVRSNSKGKGFAGGMKRHGFAGQPASHGNSKNHRTGGSLGPSQGGGSRVHPGKKMPGRMGNERVTVQNLSVLMTNNDLGIVVVKGAVAGPKGCVVKIQDAVKKDPPPQEFVDQTKKVVLDRCPDAEERLQAARVRHMRLKQARRDGSIGKMLARELRAETLAANDAQAQPLAA